jgi:phosphoenolpyruvate synthase/pyruvate phosphate dikinase
MKLCLPLEKIKPDQTQQFGGKTTALAKLVAENYNVPLSLGISTIAYRHYLSETNLQSRILMELGRKDLADMRWEEIWDAALRIRSLFLTTPVPHTLSKHLLDHLKTVFQDQPVVVRSSAPAEDSATTSFAGLHESCVNVRGPESFLLAIRKVWASLWSDRAILYRKELGLDLKTSAMAVLVQELVSGEKSGVAFSRSPTNPDSQAIEAVWGLNQGLVDGSVEPDFWELSRSDNRILNFKPAQRKIRLIPKDDDVQAVALNRSQRNTAPLDDNEVLRVSGLVMKLEKLLGQPQDVEWTWRGDELVLLQSRPITTEPAGGSAADQRSWYLSLRRSLENLQSLRKRIETEIIPGMEKDAQEMAAMNLADLDNHGLAGEVQRQRELSGKWNQQYKRYCIPMAHGIRLFGEFYNDALKPENPFEFVQLLQGEKLKALERNSQLRLLSEEIGKNPEILQAAENSIDQLPIKIHQQLHHLADAMGLEMRQILQLSVEMARKTSLRPLEQNQEALEQAYLEHFTLDDRRKAQEILELGRASQRLRDDDNISLEKIRRELSRAEAAAEQRIKEQRGEELKTLFAGNRQRGLNKSTSQNPPLPDNALRTPLGPIRTRQLQGQPASPGIVTAPARVIWDSKELAGFRSGEILICDAIDPAITFIVPLAAGIVERRGGMLIHGAIIAREYGIPCVTGIPDAASIIRSGDELTVDGYLGLVIISQK